MANTGKFTINISYMDAMGNIHSLTMGIYHEVRLVGIETGKAAIDLAFRVSS